MLTHLNLFRSLRLLDGRRRPSPHERLWSHDFWDSGCWWRVAAALNAHRAVGDYHTDTSEVAFLNAVKQILAGGLLCRVKEDEAAFASSGNQAAVQASHFGGVAGR